MAKIKLPKFRWLCQGIGGHVWLSVDGKKPYINGGFWIGATMIYETGKPNPKWRYTLIDLQKDDYDYTDGILTRIKKK